MAVSNSSFFFFFFLFIFLPLLLLLLCLVWKKPVKYIPAQAFAKLPFSPRGQIRRDARLLSTVEYAAKKVTPSGIPSLFLKYTTTILARKSERGRDV